MVNDDDYVDLGLTCNTVCAALDWGLKGKQLSELGSSVLDAITQLTTSVGSAVVGSDASLTVLLLQLQDLGRHPKQGRRAEQTECSLSSFPREE